MAIFGFESVRFGQQLLDIMKKFTQFIIRTVLLSIKLFMKEVFEEVFEIVSLLDFSSLPLFVYINCCRSRNKDNSS